MVAPRAWQSAHEILEAVLDQDFNLHLSFHLPNACTAFQPTAFSHVNYRFSTDGTPRREGGSYAPGLSALTALGNYDTGEGELILWADKKVINFPVGATILLPKWMPYSFTAVESPSYQMILAQSCESGLGEFVANGFSTSFTVVDDGPRERKRIAKEAVAGAAMYGTLAEWDALF
ncbi:hypothetical protein DFH06DRAFT_1021160 [Mycena polygramma]|nr:hypothetical protein DFH06DRAFT_1021160 [Mycena polygramma]